jgi:hypothetical protein
MVPNHVVVPPASEATQYPMILQTRPEQLSWHVIEDHQLDQLTNISRPIILGLTTTFLGAAIGLLAPALLAWEHYGPTQVLSKSDLATMLAFCCSVVAALTFGFFAARGQMDAMKVVRAIRNRPPTQIVPPQGTAVPGAPDAKSRRPGRRHKP